MSPDSPLGKLAQRVSVLEQRVEDVIARFTERVGDMAVEMRRLREDSDKDIRAFAPMVQEHHEMRAVLDLIRSELRAELVGLRQDVASLDDKLSFEQGERVVGQEDRRTEIIELRTEFNKAITEAISERDKQNRELKSRILLAIFTLMGIFVASGATLITELIR